MLVTCCGTRDRQGNHIPCGKGLGVQPDPVSWDRATMGEPPASSGLCPECAALELARIDREIDEMDGPNTSW